MQNRADARAYGMVTSLDVRVSERWKPTATRAVGTASGTAQDVKVTYADGSSEIKPVSAFRKDRTSQRAQARKVAQAPKITQVERFGLINNIGQDYS